MSRFRTFLAALSVVLLAACGEIETVEAPPPEKISLDSIGHYCAMAVMNHKGPKGQLHLKSRDSALWFTAVRDVVAYTMLFDEAKDYTAIYVTDMGRAADWDHPENDHIWVEAREAYYVVGSSKTGGMGAPETVPFAELEAANDFSKLHGGTVMRFSEIPQDAVLGGVDLQASAVGVPSDDNRKKP